MEQMGKIKAENSLSMAETAIAYNAIVDGYFSESGEYQPHIGDMNAMRVYFIMCVKESPWKAPEEAGNIAAYEEIFKDRNFRKLFHKAAFLEGAFGEMNFASAFKRAMDMVDYKKEPLNGVFDRLEKGVKGILDTFTKSMSPENLKQIEAAAKAIGRKSVSDKAGKIKEEANAKVEGFKKPAARKRKA